MAGKKAVTDRRIRVFIGIVALIGIILTAYLVREHYAPTGSSFCDVNARLNCDVVNKSDYAAILGVPVALLGLLFYLAVLVISVAPAKLVRRLGGDEELRRMLLLGAAVLGLLFTLYLTGVEAFVLHVFCPLCLGSAALVLILLGIAIKWNLRT